jgi:hypothetical protein
VIVNDFDVKCIAVDEAKADAPLIIDTNAPLPSPVAFQWLETIVRRDPEFFNDFNALENGELAERDGFDIPKSRDTLTHKKRASVSAAK